MFLFRFKPREGSVVLFWKLVEEFVGIVKLRGESAETHGLRADGYGCAAGLWVCVRFGVGKADVVKC